MKINMRIVFNLLQIMLKFDKLNSGDRMKKYKQLGYLNNDYEMFLLKDSERKNFECHFHSFYKLLIFLNGNVEYYIEGKTYELLPYDAVLVKPGDIHRPIIYGTEPYERIIIYLSDGFFENYKTEDLDLSSCFRIASQNNSNLIRSYQNSRSFFVSLVSELKQAFLNNEYGFRLFRKASVVRFLIELNRIAVDTESSFPKISSQNKTIISILEYINNHISENIQIEHIAQSLFLTRSYIMHLFKAETGMTIGKYICERRLFLAENLMSSDLSLTDIAYKCGYNSYSSFYREFIREFGIPPRDFREYLRSKKTCLLTH